MCVFEFTGMSGGPRHLHHDQDEWVYVVNGEFSLKLAMRNAIWAMVRAFSSA